MKYELHHLEEDKGKLENKISENINDIYMLTKSLESMKDSNRKLQSENDSLTKAQDHSKNLITMLENEKVNFQKELEKHTKENFGGIMMNLASLAKNKVLHQLSQYEVESISRINNADQKSEFVQTYLCDVNNILIMKDPNEKEKPQKPSKTVHIQTDVVATELCISQQLVDSPIRQK
jgi:FtsZ-binding cell division protein ZapB